MAFVSSLSAAAELLSLRTAIILIIAWLALRVCQAAYNVSPFHPLHAIPGPKLASMSYLYEFYFDFVKWGRYTRKIQRLHEVYGPLVRINPNEVHCNDAKFTDEIYSLGGRKRNKAIWHLKHTVGPTLNSGFSTLDHELHRLRRNALTRMFSKAQISKLEPVIHDLAQQLCNKILAQGDAGIPFDVTSAYSCFSSDVIASYCFGESFGFLEQDAFEPNFRPAIYSILRSIFWFRFFPLLKMAFYAEPYLRRYVPEDLVLLSNIVNVNIPNMAKKARNEHEAGIIKSRDTVFDVLLDSDLPREEKSMDRISGEAIVLLSAGTETTGWTLAVLTYYLIRNPAILAQLTEELQKAVKDPRKLPPWSTLENLPYLSAVIQEGLRLSYGVAARSPRVPTEEDLHYHGTWTPSSSSTPVTVDYVLPRGTSLSMSTYIQHHNETIFPNSHDFLPDRWLDEQGGRRKDLEQFNVAFSKGTRQCLGINLAYCELYLSLTALVLRVFPRMKLHDTTIEDVILDFDLFVPMAKKGSKGVRVMVE